MKSRLQEKLVKLILEEMSERIKERDKIFELLAEFSDFPAEKVTNEFLNAFEQLLENKKGEIFDKLKIENQPFYQSDKDDVSGREIQEPELKEEIISEDSIPEEQNIEEVQEVVEPIFKELEKSDILTQSEIIEEQPITIEEKVEDSEIHIDEKPSVYFSREKRTEIQILPSDWIYLYGFSYAPNSEGKGYPSIELSINGLGKGGNIFGIDYGDVRLYGSKINIADYVTIKTGVPYLKPQDALHLKLDYTKILNEIRVNEIFVPLEFWTVKLGRENIVSIVEDRYVDFLHALIDIHDAIDWDVDVSVLDNNIFSIFEVDFKKQNVDLRRETKHKRVGGIDIKKFEKVLFKEREIANKVNMTLTRIANKIKIDHIITLESSFIDSWKPILSARYVIGKEKRKSFHQTILDLQNGFEKFKLMISVSNTKTYFKF